MSRWLGVAAALLVACGGRTGTEQVLRFGERLWEANPERAIVILAPEMGMDPAAWSPPGGASLPARLQAAGITVLALQPVDVPPENAAHRVRAAIDEIYLGRLGGRGSQHVLGIGHGLGGTLLYHAAADGLLRGIVTLGSPVALGGASLAQRRLFDAPRHLPPDHLTWRHLGSLRLPDDARQRSLAHLLLTSGLPSWIHAPFLSRAMVRIPPELLSDLGAQSASPVPVPLPVVERLAARDELRVLAVLAPGNGMWPPWQCDPVSFGIKGPGVERLYVTRAEGFSREYGHLDLLLHPDAWSEVHPRIEAWVLRVVDELTGG